MTSIKMMPVPCSNPFMALPRTVPTGGFLPASMQWPGVSEATSKAPGVMAPFSALAFTGTMPAMARGTLPLAASPALALSFSEAAPLAPCRTWTSSGPPSHPAPGF